MLENPEKLRKMVAGTQAHSTDLQSPESVEHLCAKCDQYAENWKPVAEKLWDCFPSGCWACVTIGGNLMGVVGMVIFIPLASVFYSLFRSTVYRRLRERHKEATAEALT